MSGKTETYAAGKGERIKLNTDESQLSGRAPK
jgi:hypothetical protein